MLNCFPEKGLEYNCEDCPMADACKPPEPEEIKRILKELSHLMLSQIEESLLRKKGLTGEESNEEEKIEIQIDLFERIGKTFQNIASWVKLNDNVFAATVSNTLLNSTVMEFFSVVGRSEEIEQHYKDIDAMNN